MVTWSFLRLQFAVNVILNIPDISQIRRRHRFKPTLINFTRLLLVDYYVFGTCFTIAEAVRISCHDVGGKNVAYETPYWEEGERIGIATRNTTDKHE